MVRKLLGMKQRNDEVKKKIQESVISPLTLCKEFFAQLRTEISQKIDEAENSWISEVENSVGQLFDDVNKTDDIEERLSLLTDGIRLEKGLLDYLEKCLSSLSVPEATV